MRDIIGFFSYIFFTLIGLFLIWIALKNYGENREISQYQPPAVKQLTQKDFTRPLMIGHQFNSPTHPLQYAQISYNKETWSLNNQPSLEPLIELASKNHLLLFVQWESPKALPELRAFIKKHNIGEHIIFCSRSDGLLKDIRELEPEWSFCNGEVFLTRLLSFDSLKLGSLMKISADVLFIHLKNLNLNTDFQSLVDEGRRQNKLVFIGPVTRPMDGLSPDGWLIKPD